MRLFFNLINAMFIRAHYLCEDGIEKYAPHDRCLSPLAVPRDIFFLFHPHTHDGSL